MTPAICSFPSSIFSFPSSIGNAVFSFPSSSYFSRSQAPAWERIHTAEAPASGLSRIKLELRWVKHVPKLELGNEERMKLELRWVKHVPKLELGNEGRWSLGTRGAGAWERGADAPDPAGAPPTPPPGGGRPGGGKCGRTQGSPLLTPRMVGANLVFALASPELSCSPSLTLPLRGHCH